MAGQEGAGRPIRIAATADIHSPQYLDLLKTAVDELAWRPDLLLMAGDIIDRGRARWFGPALDTLRKMGPKRIVGVFGNEEYEEVQAEILADFSGAVLFLNDGSVTLDLGRYSVGIVGTKGSLEVPTSWQKKNVPEITSIYSRRVDLVAHLLEDLRADIRVLLMHYSPTFETLIGEDRKIWPHLGHRGYEKVIREVKPDVVLHAHAHRGSKRAIIDGVEVLNVSLPLWKRLVPLDLPRSVGLEESL